MSVSSISNTASAQMIQQLQQSLKQSQPATGTTAVSDQTTISPQARVFGQLQQLQETNPTQFKAVTSQVANQLQTKASQATGAQAQSLSNLATAFHQASQSGTLPAMNQSGSGTSTGGHHHHHHHHHHHGGSGSYSPTDTTASSSDDVTSILQDVMAG